MTWSHILIAVSSALCGMLAGYVAGRHESREKHPSPPQPVDEPVPSIRPMTIGGQSVRRLVPRTTRFGRFRWIIIGAFIALGVISAFLSYVLAPEPADTLECAGLYNHPDATRCK